LLRREEDYGSPGRKLNNRRISQRELVGSKGGLQREFPLSSCGREISPRIDRHVS
jgi:hypothetical protein